MRSKREETLEGQSAPTSVDSGERALLDRRFKMVWTFIGICLLVVAIGFILGSVSTAIWAILVAALIVFILKSPVKSLQRKGIPRWISTAILLLILLAAIVAVFVSLLPPIIEQGAQLVQSFPGYVSQIQEWWKGVLRDNPALGENPMISSWDDQIIEIIGSVSTSLETNLVSGLFAAGASIANILFVGFTAFLVAFWILVDYDKMAYEVHAIAGPTGEWYLILFSTIFSRVLGGYIKGTLIGAVITGVISGIAYWITGLPFSGVLGMLTGLLSIIPYLGPVISTVVIAILAAFSGPVALIASIAVSILTPWIVSSFISPKIMSATVNLHPGLTMLAIIGGSALGGMVGMVVAIPTVGVCKSLFVYFFEAVTGRQLVSCDGALFDGSPSEAIDPVADATDSYLDEKTLLRLVDSNESAVRKLDDIPKRSVFTLFHDLAHPVREPSGEDAQDADEEAEPPLPTSDYAEGLVRQDADEPAEPPLPT